MILPSQTVRFLWAGNSHKSYHIYGETIDLPICQRKRMAFNRVHRKITQPISNALLFHRFVLFDSPKMGLQQKYGWISPAFCLTSWLARLAPTVVETPSFFRENPFWGWIFLSDRKFRAENVTSIWSAKVQVTWFRSWHGPRNMRFIPCTITTTTTTTTTIIIIIIIIIISIISIIIILIIILCLTTTSSPSLPPKKNSSVSFHLFTT